MFKTARVYWSYLSSAKDLVILAMLAMATLGFFLASQGTSAESPDCDSNAILHCGTYSISTLKNKYNSADAEARGAFSHYGVNSSQFDNLVNGSVTSDNRVIVNGETVATNARTAGRQKLSSSDTPISGGAWARAPSVSFRQSSLSAYVHMENGVFKYAIIKSCGNPVGAVPTTTPAQISITQGKTTAPAEGSKVESGQTIHYQMTVKNNGDTTAHTVSIADAIPAGTTYVDDSFETIGDTPQPDLFDFDGSRIVAAWNTVLAGEERTIKFRVTVNNGVTDGDNICNIATTDAEEVDDQQTNQVCHEIEVPEEELTAVCKQLSASPRRGDAPLLVDFAVSAEADVGVEVESFVFDFDENGTEVVDANRNTATVREEFDEGTYDVRITEIRTNEGNFSVSDNDCAKQIVAEGEDEEPEPDFACSDLEARPKSGVSPLEVDFTARSTASGGAKAVRYNFDYDGEGTIDDTGRVDGASSIIGFHRYTEPDTYTAKVFVEFELPDGSTETVSSTDCEAKITVDEEPVAKFECVDLTATPNSGQAPLEVELVATARAENVAIAGYVFDFDSDNQADEVVTTSDTTASATHTYDSSQTARVIVVNENGETTEISTDCSADIKVEAPEEKTRICTGLSHEDIDRDTKRFTVSSQGDAELAADAYQFEVDGAALARQDSDTLTRDFSDGDHTVRARIFYDGGNTSFADCVNEFTVTTPDEQPPELPDTGPAGMISAVFGTTTLGQGLRVWLASRKKLASVLLGA